MSVTYAPQAAPFHPSVPAGVPNPPRMAVLLYLFLSGITFGIFPIIWGFKVSSWMRRIDSKSRATAWWSVYTVVSVIFGSLYIVIIASLGVKMANGPIDDNTMVSYAIILGVILLLLCMGGIFFFVAVFSARASLRTYFNSVEPINLKVYAGFTFFFSVVYIQYKLNQVCAQRGNAGQTANYQISAIAGLPNPPKMSVLLYLFLCVITFGIFYFVWGFKVSSWMRKVDPKSHATAWWAVYLVSVFVIFSFEIFRAITNSVDYDSSIFDYACNIPLYIAVYSARESLVTYFNSIEPIDLKVNRFLTFLLSTIYLQYKLNQVCARRGKLVQGQTEQPRKTTSPWEPSPAAGALHLQLAGQRYALQLGGTFTATQIPGLTSMSARGVVAEVKSNPTNPGMLGLNNQSQQTWHVTLSGGETAQIASGQTIRLSNGAQFWFGQIAGVVV